MEGPCCVAGAEVLKANPQIQPHGRSYTSSARPSFLLLHALSPCSEETITVDEVLDMLVLAG